MKKQRKLLKLEKQEPTIDDLFEAYIANGHCPICGTLQTVKVTEFKHSIKVEKKHFCPKLNGNSKFAIRYRRKRAA